MLVLNCIQALNAIIILMADVAPMMGHGLISVMWYLWNFVNISGFLLCIRLIMLLLRKLELWLLLILVC